MQDPRFENISAYLDGEMEPAEAAVFEQEIDRDPELAAIVEEIRQVMAGGHRLGAEALRAPESVWEGIASSIEEGAAAQPTRRSPAPRPRGLQIGVAQLIAACLALVMISAGAGWWLHSATNVPGNSEVPPRYAQGDPTRPIDGSAAGITPEEMTLASSIAELEQQLRARGDELDEETRTILEDNLILIDRAIREARQALASDPESEYLHAHLSRSMQRKAQFLERATRLGSSEI